MTLALRSLEVTTENMNLIYEEWGRRDSGILVVVSCTAGEWLGSLMAWFCLYHCGDSDTVFCKSTDEAVDIIADSLCSLIWPGQDQGESLLKQGIQWRSCNFLPVLISSFLHEEFKPHHHNLVDFYNLFIWHNSFFWLAVPKTIGTLNRAEHGSFSIIWEEGGLSTAQVISCTSWPAYRPHHTPAVQGNRGVLACLLEHLEMECLMLGSRWRFVPFQHVVISAQPGVTSGLSLVASETTRQSPGRLPTEITLHIFPSRKEKVEERKRKKKKEAGEGETLSRQWDTD